MIDLVRLKAEAERINAERRPASGSATDFLARTAIELLVAEISRLAARVDELERQIERRS